MEKVNRESLLRRLQSVSPGLTPKEGINQSDCFVFTDNEILTFNDEVACRIRNPVKGIKGAVKAAPLLAILAKLPDEEVSLSMKNDNLMVKGKGRSGIAMEAEILLPVEGIPKPTKWTKLPDGFSEAIGLVHHCASPDERRKFSLSLVHFQNTTKASFVESSDNVQMCRWTFKGKFLTDEALVKKVAIAAVSQFGVVEVAQSTGWICFRNVNKLVFACRTYSEHYPEFDEFLKGKGQEIHLPKSLAKVVDRASIFTKESEFNRVKVQLKKDKVIIRGEGPHGHHEEPESVEYTGPEMTFRISPEILSEVINKYPDCKVDGKHLRVDGGSYKYVSCLEDESSPEEADEK